MARMTKEELKGNELIIYFREIAEFFKKYWEKLKVILLVAGIATLFIVLVLLGNARTNSSAMAQLNSALAIYQNQQFPLQERCSKAKELLKTMLDSNSTGNLKYEVLFYLGSCHYFLGEYDEAIEAFKKCTAGMGRSSLGIYALQSLGKSYESKGSYEEALKIYKDTANKYPKHFLKANVLLDIGRCYEKLGKADEAINTYQKILDSSPQSAWAREAIIRINVLKG
jgi:tetratricopeptide (TPR) repeat protein